MNRSYSEYRTPESSDGVSMQRIADCYVNEPKYIRDFIDHLIQFIPEEKQSEFQTALSLFGLLTLEERLQVVEHDYEQEVLLSIDRSKTKEEQFRTKLEAFVAIDHLMELGVFTSDRYEALSDEINRIFERR